MNLFLVTSPFQYICALEAKREYACQNNILLLVDQDSEPGISQQGKLLDQNEWDYIIQIPRTNRSKQVPIAIKKIKKICNDKFISYFFHAEYNAWRTKLILKNLIINTEVYFDDGTLTINEYEEEIRHKSTYFRPRFIQDIMIRLNGLKPIGKLEQSSNLEIFTIFDIPNPEHVIIKNSLSVLKDRFKITNLFNPNAPIGFIGQGAIGHKRRKTIDEYVNEIKHFVETYSKPIIYFPHRTETEEIKNRILEIPNVTYHYSEFPLEIELIDKKIMLSGLVGVLSTVQYTASLLYTGMPVYNLSSPHISENTLIKDREQRIKKAFEKIGVIETKL
ncbi:MULTISPECIES: glycosyltransferase 52 family protein [Vibrio]|uniref:Glycosyltransferase 52 family protein n=1 Tax=Vibrio rotiferianus TaxID=190895 RepID=A0ABX3D464_9VIBR|nr:MULTISPECIES: glycosyltransferase 52 family protein [Vibrio]MDK9775073.1 glycosyltransferase 52 family protein [Vibrio sp. D401a]MDK9807739.1 glycosyltransferase 52 family protein [Vibrio sp. D406a]OHY90005.1 glycosyltransferase 52 family protein [Vibrio rotiferianus]USD50182.1 glycosyltransferase 52 family protein [Vibrio sp. SCSIO 43153]